jgi:anion-transporting  ArsA/GET3 family ATPase
VDEAVAISKVVQFVKSPEYAHFSRIIFDTAPTGHTLRLLTLPDFLDATLGALSATAIVSDFQSFRGLGFQEIGGFIFNSAPTGHVLHLLMLADALDATSLCL